MTPWLDWFDGPFATAAWQIVALVALLALAQLALRRRVRPATLHLLWWLVAFRALLPFVPEDSWERLGLAHTRAVPLPSDVPMRAAARFETREPLPRPVPETPQATTTTEPTEDARPTTPRERTSPSVAIARPSTPDAAPSVPVPQVDALDAPSERNGSRALFLVWLAGTLACAVRLVLLELASRRRLRRAVPVDDRAVLAVCAEAARLARVPRPPRILATDALRAPALIGFVRPRILLPARLVAEGEPDRLRHVLLHELHHLRARDVWWNALLCLVDVLYWFHPAVRFGLRRLRAQREIVRDWQALASARRDDPRTYAGTLVHLLERFSPLPGARAGVAWLDDLHDLRNRIMWILRFDARRSARSPWPVATTLAAGSALLVLAAPTISRAEARALAPQDEERIRVTRQDTTPPWKAAIESKLETATVTLEQEELDPRAFLQACAAQLEIAILPDRGARESLDDGYPLRGSFDALPATAALDHVAEACGLVWAVARGAVVLTSDPGRYDLGEVRLYDVGPLLDRVDDPEVLMELLVTFVAHGETWDWDPMQAWGRLLMVRTRDRVHRDVEAFLNQLLQRGRGNDAPPAWRTALDAKLDTPVDVEFVESPVEDVVAQLRAQGLPMMLRGDWQDAEPVDFAARGMRARDVLAWIADLTDLRLAFHDGRILLCTDEPKSLRVYEVGDLFEDTVGTFGELDAIEELLHGALPPDAWDREGCGLQAWDGLLVVRQTEACHGRIAALLDALRRALRS